MRIRTKRGVEKSKIKINMKRGHTGRKTTLTHWGNVGRRR